MPGTICRIGGKISDVNGFDWSAGLIYAEKPPIDENSLLKMD